MKKSINIFIGIMMLLICSCNDNCVENHIPQKEPKILISNLTAEIGRINLTILAIDGNLKAYDRWGIVYSETSDKDHGQEVIADNKPADKSG